MLVDTILAMKNIVLVGEMEVLDDKMTLLSRQEGNGILNSILQGSCESNFTHLNFRFTAWDRLTLDEWKAGKSDIPYKERFHELDQSLLWNTKVKVIPHFIVRSLKEAYALYSDYTSQGYEGVVIKSPDSLWKDGTAKDIVKLKVKFQADYVIAGKYEGTGKAKGMLGGFDMESLDGKIKFSVGSGFTDEQRKKFWQRHMLGKIATVEANDISTKENSSTLSLFLPIFIEERFDKTQADTYDHVLAQLEAAKNGT